ncbi:hypothetical protein SAMN05421774_106225 [Gemmobacter megaterium]|uniref:Tetratricopeptide repeat-containing protein n=2 Tax=Gemmobacter megaterium TaxID=1086013 RepID=A0A1N7PXL6_9RHOB|nr:hypothetical protein SAMN05421774_106225 [Gemmobacter megaterium]
MCTHMNRLATLLALCLALTPPVFAQEAPQQDELLALNFYIAQKDATAINAELRRLQLKYPGWTPPRDLSRLNGAGPSAEIDQIYARIAAGSFADARALIASTQAEYPDWTPPEDMLALLNTSEGQQALDRALADGQLDQALRIASGTAGLLRCDRVNNAWRIAELQDKAGRQAAALTTYRAILSACTEFESISATLEKADTVADAEALKELFAQSRTRFPARASDLTELEARLLAGRGDVAVPEAAANPVRPEPRPRPAATAAAPSAAATGGAGGGSAAAAARSGDWARCLALTNGARAAGALYERAWCAYNMDRTMEAVSAFQSALAAGLDADRTRDARYGLALAYLKLQMPDNAASIAVATNFTRSQRVDIERQILDQRGVAAYSRKEYRKAIEYFDAIETIAGGLRRDLAILRAYAYLNSGNRDAARRQFEKINNQLSTDASRAGLAVTE